MTERAERKAFFSRSIEANVNALYGAALRLTGKTDDAEDLVAESVAKAWVAIDSLSDRTLFRPWVFRILRNCFISEYRKKSVRPTELTYEELSVDDDSGDIASLLADECDDFLDWWANPEHQFFNDLLGEEIMRAISQLPESFRTTILLINVEGLTYDEAAEVLGVPEGTIRSRMKRGRTLLQKALWLQATEAGLTTAGNKGDLRP